MMKRRISFWTVVIVASLLPLMTMAVEGFEPPRPQSSVQGSLHVSPDIESPVLRVLQSSDKVEVLRNQGNWFEVDVTTDRGFLFRGWIQAESTRALIKPDKPIDPLVSEKRQQRIHDPLRSKTFLWFWSGDIDELASISLQGGLQRTSFNLSGVLQGQSERSNIPGYGFFGLDLGVAGELSLLETSLYDRNLKWQVYGKYQYGFIQVSFGSDTALPADVRGEGYQISTNTVQFDSRVRYQLGSWPDTLLFGKIGLGIFYHESAPDLRRTQGSGNVVFTQAAITSFLTRLELEALFIDKIRVTTSFAPLFVSSIEESPNQSLEDQEVSVSGIPFLFALETRYHLNERWSVFGNFDFMKASGKLSGSSRRIDQIYEDVSIKFGYLRTNFGVGLHF